MNIIKTDSQAIVYFLENRGRNVTVENSSGEQKVCSRYLEARDFLIGKKNE